MQYEVTAPANPDDVKATILSLLNRNFSETTDDWYQWSYRKNPFGQNSCWLVESEPGETVGMTGLMPRDMKIGNQTYEVGQAANISINQEHRSAQAAIKLQRALLAKIVDSEIPVVFGITETAVAVFRRTGYKVVGDLQRWTKPLRSEYKLQERIQWKLPRKIAAFAIDQTLKYRSAEMWSRGSQNFKTETVTKFDERFDELWSRQTDRREILIPRTKKFLTWRFGEEPKTAPQILTILNSDDQLLGYLVYQLPTADSKHQFAEINDCYFDDVTHCEILLAELCRQLRATTVDAITMKYFGNPKVSAALMKFGFFQRPTGWKVLAYKNPKSNLDSDFLLNEENWQMTDAEIVF